MNPVLREHLEAARIRDWHERLANKRVSAMRLEMRQIQEQEEKSEHSNRKERA